MKIIGVIIVSIWMFGTIGMYAFYTFDRRGDCIQNEGWIKGFFWCETDPKSRIEVGIGHTSMMFKSMMWPVTLLEDSPSIPVYQCSDFIRDLKSAKQDLEANKRLFSILEYTYEDDRYSRSLAKLMRTYYQDDNPSDDQIRMFAGMSATTAIEICKNNPSLSVKDAIIDGAELIANQK